MSCLGLVVRLNSFRGFNLAHTWYVLEFKNYIISIYFYSKAKIQPSPQINNRRKTHAKLWKFFYLLLILWYIGANMATTSTTKVDMETDMVDENEMNSSFQKCPTMAQVSISQKKAKGKLVTKPKRLPFWFGFQAMN